MRPLILSFLALLGLLPAAAQTAPPAITPATAAKSVVRIRSTSQSWKVGQPWERTRLSRHAALAILVAPGKALTTAEMVADATFIEFESIDATRTATAKVEAVDYESNLALLGLADPQADSKFFAGKEPVALAEDPAIGDTLDIVQVEDNGNTMITRATLRSVDVSSTFLPGQSFLTFELKASMQSASNSFTLPVLSGRNLVGILSSYDSKEQISQVIATEILRHFLEQSTAEGAEVRFPSIGISTTSTDDPSFRKWLKLPESTGGMYVGKVRKGSPAATAGLKKGDVILSIDDSVIDRRGYFKHPEYGPLFWSHLIRGSKTNGSKIKLGIWRDGKPTMLEATLECRNLKDELVPSYRFGTAPPYLVKGGFIFQELSRPLLRGFGKDWQSKAPLNLLDILLNPDDHAEGRHRVTFLSGVIPTPATVGYEQLRNLVIAKVNGRKIEDTAGLIEAFQHPSDGLHSIEFEDEDFTIYLDQQVSDAVDAQLMQRGIPHLSHSL